MPMLLVIRYPEEGPGLMVWGRRVSQRRGQEAVPDEWRGIAARRS